MNRDIYRSDSNPSSSSSIASRSSSSSSSDSSEEQKNVYIPYIKTGDFIMLGHDNKGDDENNVTVSFNTDSVYDCVFVIITINKSKDEAYTIAWHCYAMNDTYKNIISTINQIGIDENSSVSIRCFQTDNIGFLHPSKEEFAKNGNNIGLWNQYGEFANFTRKEFKDNFATDSFEVISSDADMSLVIANNPILVDNSVFQRSGQERNLHVIGKVEDFIVNKIGKSKCIVNNKTTYEARDSFSLAINSSIKPFLKTVFESTVNKVMPSEFFCNFDNKEEMPLSELQDLVVNDVCRVYKNDGKFTKQTTSNLIKSLSVKKEESGEDVLYKKVKIENNERNKSSNYHQHQFSQKQSQNSHQM